MHLDNKIIKIRDALDYKPYLNKTVGQKGVS